MKKIVIAIDSFKGCLHSLEVGKAAEKGIKTVFPTCETRVLPVSDGGEGLLDTLVTVLHGHFQQVRVHNPLMEPIEKPLRYFGRRENGNHRNGCGKRTPTCPGR